MPRCCCKSFSYPRTSPMSGSEDPSSSDGQTGDQSGRRWTDQSTLATVALCLVVGAASWYLLKELASLLRPLLLAVFLCYIIIPSHLRLKQRIPGPASMLALAGVTVGIILL